MRRYLSLFIVSVFPILQLGAQDPPHKFKQLYQELATPNVYRTASGAPGPAYWQQRADYSMDIILDDQNQRIYGTEEITYYNNSPDALDYLWIQLDQNVRTPDSDTKKISTGGLSSGYYGQRAGTNQAGPMRVSLQMIQRLFHQFDGGFRLEYVKDSKGKDLPVTVNKTMMRIDLATPLKHGQKFQFSIKWWYNINDRMRDGGGRSGMEYFPEDDNYLYTIAQFYPRMAVYSDFQGWQNKQFLGRGEFTLTFGNFDVRITTPADHILGATGVLQNPQKVLTAEQRTRLQKARTADKPVLIVTQQEAENAEKYKATATKTWHFKAQHVRDFAFASSRKFIWDAMGVKFGDRIAMAMSYYPKEGNPLWGQYSTRVVAHTMKTYSKYTFPFPYPKAISVHTARIGMEYPMICFNGGRPEPDGTYSEETKYGMISVIIHEVGHNFFPMIVNSDERQWTWMDEGMNTFLQGIAEREWDENWPNWKGEPKNIVYYMRSDKVNMVPIMTNSESLIQFGSNAYSKPATALNILRETVMGPELFEFAFKQYAQRWMFKHPTPADFFRTMEDASAVDLDWFWRGWFFSTDHVDIGITQVKHYLAGDPDPEVVAAENKQTDAAQPEYVYFTRMRKAGFVAATQRNDELKDFYNSYDKYRVTDKDKKAYQRFMQSLTNEEKALIKKHPHFYEITFNNVGGLVMPVILKMTFTDGQQRVERIPAQIWQKNTEQVTRLFITEKEVTQFELDPCLETADTDRNNNYWPPKTELTRFQIYKSRGPGNRQGRPNPMRESKKK
ncbi:MAG: M1 family metallopeptidase [Bacteroidales bacterium]|nr:M1 family metallopeptidase [Bacteroidales bacterium]